MISNISFVPQNNFIYKNNNQTNTGLRLKPQLTHDTVSFTGQSPASFYETTFDYLASHILKRDKSYQVSNADISSKLIRKAVDGLFGRDDVYRDFPRSDASKIKWKSYIPQDIREYSVDKVNQARADRINEWKTVLTEPEKLQDKNPKLAEKLKKSNSLKLVIWDAITSEIKPDNRHIPVPFSDKALLDTVERFESIKPIDRSVTCSTPSFIDYYTHRMRDNLLMDMGYKKDSLQKVWVTIPSFKHEPKNKDANVAKLEILSNKNWCTRSSVDKAYDALTDGDFHIFLKRNKSQIWEPSLGMTSYQGKIDQIQGKENDNIIPLELIPELEKFVEKTNLKYNSGVSNEGPKARQAVQISKKLKEKNESGKTFYQAIHENNDYAMLEFLNRQPEKLENGNLRIGTYRPYYNLDVMSGVNVPYSMFGISESNLLRNVEEINGDFVLKHKNNRLYDSGITEFPPKLKSVKGKIICSEEQYEKFGEEMKKVVDNPNRIYVS